MCQPQIIPTKYLYIRWQIINSPPSSFDKVGNRVRSLEFPGFFSAVLNQSKQKKLHTRTGSSKGINQWMWKCQHHLINIQLKFTAVAKKEGSIVC